MCVRVRSSDFLVSHGGTKINSNVIDRIGGPSSFLFFKKFLVALGA